MNSLDRTSRGWFRMNSLDRSSRGWRSIASVNKSQFPVAPNGYNGSDVTVPDLATPSAAYIALGVLLGMFVAITIFGNLLVIIAVARERFLRSVTNYFIVSLAVADLVIGSVVMPFSITLELTAQIWPFGIDWCDLWHSVDVLASTASILNLSVIALDRYWAITDPISYPTRMSTARALWLIVAVWFCSAAISFPAILWWRAVADRDSPNDGVCAFTDDSAYLILSSIISFYVPVVVILFAYRRIYAAASAQTRGLRSGTKVLHSNGERMTLRMHRGGNYRSTATLRVVRYSRTMSVDIDARSPRGTLIGLRESSSTEAADHPTRKWKPFTIKRKLGKLAKEQKATKTLGIVMGIFCVCWVPFFFTNLLFAICGASCIAHADIVFPVFTWLGYINSGMNPIIYACSMRDFRRAFYKIVYCCCPTYYLRRHRRRYNPSITTSSFTT